MNPFDDKNPAANYFTDEVRNQLKALETESAIKMDLLGNTVARARMAIGHILGHGKVRTRVSGGELWVKLKVNGE